jgi:hypothetical protein
LSALQNNDEPQLDHGACVVLEFKSPGGVLDSCGLDPGKYGSFLRSEYGTILDFRTAEFLGEAEDGGDSLSKRQRIQVLPFGDGKHSTFDFYLSKHEDLWLVDVIVAVK